MSVPAPPNPFIKQTFQRPLRALWPAAHAERYASGGVIRILLALSFFGLSGAALAQLDGETLVLSPPPEYKIGFESKQGNMVMTEMVPQNETVQNWTEMLTTQVFLGMKNATPQQFRDFMKAQTAKACPNSQAANVFEGVENGYPFALWIQDCPLVQQSGKPERTWLKAIRGRDSFYVVQKAFRFQPTEQQVVKWMQYLREVYVCDTRSPEQKCP